MTRNIRAILSPLLIISYVCGLRIVEFPAGYPRLWLSCLYDLLLWLTYYFLIIDFMLSYLSSQLILYKIFLSMKILIGVLSFCINFYYDKKFRNCLRKLSIVDETLKELGITTDFEKLNTKMAKFVAGWFAIVLIMSFGDIFSWQDSYNVLTAFYIVLLVNYTSYTNLLDDMTYIYILGYIGLKFNQINELLNRLADGEFTDRERRIKRTWENTIMRLHRSRDPNAPSSEFIMWTVIHLYLELCKISHEMDSIFGIQITIKIVSYFCFIAVFFLELFYLLLDYYMINKKWLVIIVIISWVSLYLCRIFWVNYSCEIISNKANTTRDFINKLMYSTRNAEIREHIVYLLLYIIQAPLKFYGAGFFQFGFKFIHKYCTNIVTLMVILLQTTQHEFLKKFK